MLLLNLPTTHIDAPAVDSTPIVVALEEHPKQDQVAIAAKALSPLLDAIADVEGGSQALNAVNRGYAGDTPGGSSQALGRSLTDMTVSEVIQAQRWTIYAAGAYQFIPKTLKELVDRSGFDTSRRFDRAAQQELAVLNIKHNRPHVWRYVLGEPVSSYKAALEMAKEWASLGTRPTTSRTTAASAAIRRRSPPTSSRTFWPTPAEHSRNHCRSDETRRRFRPVPGPRCCHRRRDEVAVKQFATKIATELVEEFEVQEALKNTPIRNAEGRRRQEEKLEEQMSDYMTQLGSLVDKDGMAWLRKQIAG